MSGKNSLAQFKATFGASSTFVGGNIPPDQILIVGLDIPLQDDPTEDGYNGDLWDEARLAYALSNPIDPEKMILTVNMGGSVPPIKVVRRSSAVLCVEGRRRVMGARAANNLLLKRGGSVDTLIEISVIVARGDDLDVDVRIGNEGRLDDPPWIKAMNASRLRARGKSDVQIAAVFDVQIQTIGVWAQYMNLHPSIRAEVETDALPRDKRVPFMVGCEIGRLGREEGSKQILALQYLRAQGARLTGEQGKENVKNVVRAIQRGELTKSVLSPPLQETGDAPEPFTGLNIAALSQGSEFIPPVAEGTPDSLEGDFPAVFETPAVLPAQRPEEHNVARPVRQSSSLSKARTERPVRIVTDFHFPPRHIREVLARLEPTQEEPLETSEGRAVLAALAVILGVDPTGEGLSPWTEVHSAFKPFLRRTSLKQPDATGASPMSKEG